MSVNLVLDDFNNFISDTSGGTSPGKILGLVFFYEYFDGWESLHAVTTGGRRILVAIDGGDFDDSLEKKKKTTIKSSGKPALWLPTVVLTNLQRFGGLRVFGRETLAVAAPRGVELDHPYVVALQYVLREIVVGELDHVGVGRVDGRRALGQGRQTNACKTTSSVVNVVRHTHTVGKNV